MRSPTKLTLDYFRKRGCICRVTERWNAYARKRIDLFGGDIQAIAGNDLLSIQATSGAHHAARVAKSLDNPEVLAWLKTGNHFLVVSWAKKRERRWDGSRMKRVKWVPRCSRLIVRDEGIVVELFLLR